MSNNTRENHENETPKINDENLEQNARRIKDVRNPKITKENFVKDAENAVPPLAWKNQEKAYDDAWENNKNQQLDDV